MPFAKPKQVSISLTIAACFLALVVALLGTVVWTSYQASHNTALKLVAQLAQRSLLVVNDELRDHLEPVVHQVNWTARLISKGGNEFSEPGTLGNVLIAATAATPQVTALVYMGADKSVTRAFREPTEKGWRIDTGPARNLGFAVKILKRAAVNPDGYWNDILYSVVQKRSYVNYVKPVWRDGKFLGAVLAAVSLNEMSVLVSDISDQLGGTVFILSGKDKVIAHPNLTSDHPDLSSESPTVDISRVGDLVLPNFWSATTHPIQLETDLEGFAILHAVVTDQRYIFISGTVPDYGSTPWTVGGYVDARTAEEAFRSVRLSALIGLVLILVGSVVAIYLGRMIARPIKVASTRISRIAELEVDQVRELEGSRIAELDAQAQAFNKMLGALRLFAVYVPRSLVSRLIRLGGQEVVSEQREITVLFTDLAGFTAASENMTAEQTAELLNHHFALLAKCVEAEGGTIDKFMGDALMAFWGAPDRQPDHALRAARASCAMALAVEKDNAARREAGAPVVRMRIGLHSGPAVVGNIGAPERMNYTVVGDTVNTAQRMEQLGKQIDGEAETIVLVTEDVLSAGGPEIEHVAVGALTVKGKVKPIDAFRLTVEPG